MARRLWSAMWPWGFGTLTLLSAGSISVSVGDALWALVLGAAGGLYLGLFIAHLVGKR